jgi:hypothetical protein
MGRGWTFVPRYFFAVRWPKREHDDPTGTLFPSDSDARQYADRIIRELKQDRGYDDPRLALIMKDADGKIIVSIPFQKVLQKSSGSE